MQFCTKYKRPEKIYEKSSNECLVETQGYISAQQRIENMMLAGQRLSASRKEMYDFPDGKIDENFTDPTRQKNFDLADATKIKMITEEKIKDAQKRQKALESIKNDDKGVTTPDTKSPE